MIDGFGLDVHGFHEGNTHEDNIKALYKHQGIIDGLHSESSGNLDRKIHELKMKLESEKR